MTPATSAAEESLDAIERAIDEHGHGRVPRALRRRQIVAVAEQLFVERGYTATSMDDLATRVGVSKPVIYETVGAKDAVFEACVERVADELAAQVAQAVVAADPEDEAAGLRAGALAWFEFIGQRRALWEALLSSSDIPTTDAVEAIRSRQDGFVAQQLIDGAAERGVDVDVELAGAVATAMNGAFEALGRWWHDHEDRSAAELADLYTALVLPGLSGLFALSAG
ncbi:TetR/AcrR family transcriptional regulator [Actinospongicola halichondriae]|uniref:TetR/AcrR family transcriptional regulator n=1 Tax=Actinospongicola halichondriae TaxID=3236844 RepID=UPI003D38CB7E